MAVTGWRYGQFNHIWHLTGERQLLNPHLGMNADSQWATFQSRARANAVSAGLRIRGFGLGAEVPAGAQITGIEVQIKRSGWSSDDGMMKDQLVALAQHNFSLGDSTTVPSDRRGVNKASPVMWRGTPVGQGTLDAASTTVTYGGDGDMWGSSLTRAEITSDFFAVDVQADLVSEVRIGYVDFVRVRVHYSFPEPARNVTITGAVRPAGSASANQARRNLNASISATVAASGTGSASHERRTANVSIAGRIEPLGSASSAQIRPTSTADLNGSIQPSGSASATQARRLATASVTGHISPYATASVTPVGRSISVTISGSVRPTGSVSASQIVRTRGVSMAGRISATGGAHAAQIRPVRLISISGQISPNALITARQIARRAGVSIIGRVEISGSMSAAQHRRTINLMVDPIRLITVPPQNRTLTVAADRRALTALRDDRRAK